MSTNRLPKRVALGTATFLASGALALSGVSVAHADEPVGTLSISSPTGLDNDPISVTTSGACDNGAYLIGSVSGAGFPDGGYGVVPNSTITTYTENANGGYTVPLLDTMRAFAATNSIAALSGKYTFTITCRNAFGATTYGSFTGSIWFTDPTVYAASLSDAIPFTVSAATGGGNPGAPAPGTENINTTVAPGALALSVAGSNVNLPPLTLNATSTLFAAAGPIQSVTVTDTRAGAPGWALSGQVADFTSGANAISAQNLGWVPNLVNKGDGLKINLGGAVAPANGVPSSDAGALGLKSSRTLATATGLGTAQIGADLSLVAPTSTVAGSYTGVLTLTVM